MPRFTFNVAGGPASEVELPSLADAKCEAVRFAGRMICDRADSFWDAKEFQLTVSDDTGLVLFTLNLIATPAPAMPVDS